MNRRTSTLSTAGLAGIALALASCSDAPVPGETLARTSSAVDTLNAVTSFGSNPGNLLMYTYVPSGMPPSAPLVIALHGCGETATDYEAAGWDEVAEASKFYVLYPQQQDSNNVEGCFNWFGNTSGNTADITRGQGEGESIIQMIDTMKSTYSIDSKRIYVTGFSAGAAYAIAMLAMYPDVFAGGASFAGIPFGCANSLSTAYTCMSSPPMNSASQWAQLARAGFSGYGGPYPKLSVWQGSEDTTVSTSNLAAIVAQWTALTGASQTATTSNMVDGYPHDEYADGSGNVLVESYSITGMAHGVAIDVSNGCGTASEYFVDKQICSVQMVAQFLGIASAQGGGSSGSSGGGASSGSGGGSGGNGSGGGSGGSGSSGTGSGSGSGSGAGSGSGSGAGGASSGSAAAPTGDAGAGAAEQTLPGCSMGVPVRWGGEGMIAGLALGLAAVLRRRVR